MDVFNKLKNSLSSTVNEITAALPGNPLLREYETGSQLASYGPAYLWKVYSGVKKSSKVDVSIFIFEKKKLEEFPKNKRELVLNLLKRGVAQLTRLKHPKVLTVEHGLEESRESLVFCTEPIFATLGNVLKNFDNISNVPPRLNGHKLYDVEIKYGLLQLAEAFSFLHSHANMLHGNLCPESIVINKSGAWKLAGFDFCVTNAAAAGDSSFSCLDWDTSLPVPCLPNPNYLAVEYVTKRSCDTASDMFSLGMLLYCVYHDGKTLYQCNIHNVNRTFALHEDKLRHLSVGQLHNIPNEAREHVKMLLHPDSSVRPDANQMTKLPFFEDIGVATLAYLDSLLQYDNLQKSQFFKNLTPIIDKFPQRVSMQRVLPKLTGEFSNYDMIPFVLPTVFKISENCNKEEFLQHIFPHLIPVFKVQSPVQVLLILLQKMDLLLKKTSVDLVRAHVLPMLANALSSNSIQTQELCLTVIPNFAENLDFSAMKNSVIPRIKKIVVEGGSNGVRINSLVCLGKIISYFDKWFVSDEILTTIYEVRSREPGILMAILGIFKTAMTHSKLGLSKDVLAQKAIPFLLPLSIENNLNFSQFQAYMSTIKDMLQQVEKEQGSKLEQLGKIRQEQDSAVNFEKLKAKSAEQNNNHKQNEISDVFSSPNLTTNGTNNTEVPQLKRQHLTLEEKQNLAKAKEKEFMMKKQGPLKPKQVSPPLKQKPKDLTSTLMSSQFSSMNISKPNNSFNGRGMVTSNSNMMQPALQTTMNPSQNQPKPSWQQTYSSMTPKPAQMQQNKSNLTSFDSLLTMPSHNRNVPMSQMRPQSNIRPTMTAPSPMMPSPMQNQTFNQPMMQPQNNMAFQKANPFGQPARPPANSQPLSNNDILDFLG